MKRLYTITYLDDLSKSPLKYKIKLVNKGYFPRSGYGRQLPTERMIRWQNRWYRVYCMIYGNIGSCYIVTKGRRIFIR